MSAPQAPSDLSATPVGDSVELEWTVNSTNEQSIVVQRAPAVGGPYSTIATLPSGTDSYIDGNLAALRAEALP